VLKITIYSSYFITFLSTNAQDSIDCKETIQAGSKFFFVSDDRYFGGQVNAMVLYHFTNAPQASAR